MRVLITGGTGFIGRAVTADLAGAGYEVVLLSRGPAGATGLPAGVRVERWDGRTAAGWSHLADDARAIVNLAGENLAGSSFFPARWTPERKALIRRSRLDTGAAVVAAVTAAPVKPRVVIQASGIGHYGTRSEKWLTEADGPGDDFLARLTVEWEASTAGVTQFGVRHASIRTGVVLTPDSGALRQLLLPFKLYAGGPLGSGRQGFSWIHPDDEVAAIRFLIEDDRASGPFNLCSPQPLSNLEFAKILGRVLGRPAWLPVPGFALEIGAGRGRFDGVGGAAGNPAKVARSGLRVSPS